MYSIVMLTAMSAGADTPPRPSDAPVGVAPVVGVPVGCHGWNGCYGGYGGSCYGACHGWGGGCHGGGHFARRHGGGFIGKHSCHGFGGYSCSGYNCFASCYGGGYGGYPGGGYPVGQAVPPGGVLACGGYAGWPGGYTGPHWGEPPYGPYPSPAVWGAGASIIYRNIPPAMHDPNLPPVMTVPVAPTPKPGGSDNPPPMAANIKFKVPADTKIYVDGRLTQGTGPERSFFTPPLGAGKFFYDVKAELTVDGKTITEEKRVIVEAGANLTETFPKLSAAAPTTGIVAGK